MARYKKIAPVPTPSIATSRPNAQMNEVPSILCASAEDLNRSHSDLLGRICAVRQALECAVAAKDLSEDVMEIQRSHVKMSMELETIRESLAAADTRISSIRPDSLHQRDMFSLKRTLEFARLRAVSCLSSGSQELSRRPGSLSAYNTVLQITLKSKATDCTLHEFQQLAMAIDRRASIENSNSPSDYSVRFPSASCTSHLAICFPSYRDMCTALEIDAHNSNLGIYREKGDESRNLRAIQVLGVDMGIDDNRKILLGRSFPSSPITSAVPYLYQDGTAWREGSWESGFSFGFDILPSLGHPRETATMGRFGSRPRVTARIDTALPDKLQFCVTWERFSDMTTKDLDPALVPGFLRSLFPAVVLRSRLLAISTQKAFQTKFIGRLPKALIMAGESTSSQTHTGTS